MPGDFLRRLPQVTMAQFHAFRDERPKEEKWELIDGVPTMMPPPTLVHQRISRNLETLLNHRLGFVKPEWQADREIGVLLPDDDKYNPEPDVTVIDTEIALGQLYAERFYAVAEVLSPNDKAAVLALKLDYYKAHQHCLAVCFISHERVETELHLRDGESWRCEKINQPAGRIELPQIGDIGCLKDLYRYTPLHTDAE